MTTTRIPAPADTHKGPDAQNTHQRRWPSTVLAVVSVLCGTAAIAVHASFYGYWIVDDAAITFAYARSVAEGLGSVLQPGALPVEGFSNPAWLLLLVVGRWLGLFDHGSLFGFPDYALYPKGLALLCCAGILTACYLAARRVLRRPWLATLLVGLVLAAIPSFVIWSFSGLENSLYAFLAVSLAVLIFRATLDERLLTARIAILTGLLAAAAALTRPDGLIYIAAYPIVLLIGLSRHTVASSIRYAALSVVSFIILFGSYVCWRYVTFGKLLPNTATAKSQGIPGLDNLTRVGELVTYIGTPLTLVATLVIGMAVTQRLWWHRALLSLLVPLGLALLAFVILKPDWMPQYRFATPVWALGALVGTLTTTAVLQRAWKRRRAWVSATLAVSLVVSGITLARAAEEFRAAPTVPMCYVVDRFGRTFNGYADILQLEHASLLLPDIGGTALTSRLHIYDLAGLASPRIAEFMAKGNMEGLRNYIFNDLQPTFIHTHGGWSARSGIPADPRLAEHYYSIYRHPAPDSPNGDWVRKSAVPNKQVLRNLRQYAQETIVAVRSTYDQAPLRHCGATLRRGQTIGQLPD